MDQAAERGKIDWLTVFAMGVLIESITTGMHEGTHALACVLVGGDLREFSALHVDCVAGNMVLERVVAGSAAIVNILLGFLAYSLLRSSRNWSGNGTCCLWLFFLINLLVGTGYFVFSGIGGVGDWATVIDGLQPAWLWRAGLSSVGLVAFMGAIVLALRTWGKLVGGTEPECYSRSIAVTFLAYGGAVVTSIIAGLMNPYGFLSLPSIAGLLATVGALSPMLWMMFWFQARMFPKEPGQPLTVRRSWSQMLASCIVGIFFAIILGRGLTLG